jgi:Flp pilus assembly protein TadB
MTPLVVGVLVAAAALCLLPPRPGAHLAAPPDPPLPVGRSDGRSDGRSGGDGWARRGRLLWALLAAAAGATFFSGQAAVPMGLVAGGVSWVVAGRAEPRAVRRTREAAERDLPGLVHLLGTALEVGCDVGDGLRLVCAAHPGAAADALGLVPTRLALGLDPVEAWAPVAADPTLAPLARAMMRAHRSGSSVVSEVARLADELAARARQQRETRARTVGVRAAVPLGLCLLPAFVLVGVVPLVVGLLRSLHL